MTRLPLLAALCLFSLAPSLRGADTDRPAKPNLIFINIDDLGYADIGPFGSKLNRTPHLDRMAKEGRRLTSFYAAPVCSPSRAALMTGCYPKRGLPIPHVLFPANDVGLSSREVTVAEVLKAQGYATAVVGKWHLGDQPEFLPSEHGFDLHFGLPYSNDMGPASDGVKTDLGKPIPQGRTGGQPPLPLLRNGKVVKRVLPDDQQSLVEIYTSEALDFIAKQKDKPFFLYLAHSSVHFPIYPGKKWAGNSPHGYYSDWVEETDWSVGQVLDAVRQAGLAEKTLVIFTSDNGGTPRGLNTPLRGHKGSTLEGGMRVPTIAWWPGQVPAGTETDAIAGMFDILPTFAALSGGKVPDDRKIDGVNIWPQIKGDNDAKPAHETFYYFRGLKLEAVRHGDWKLHRAGAGGNAKNKAAAGKAKLYNLKEDIGEANDVAAEHSDIVTRLEALAEVMDKDLGNEGIGPGVRELGRVKEGKPIINQDGTIRSGFEAAADETQEKWIPLFNGKDLKDWTVKINGHELGDNYKDTFYVEEGLLKVGYKGYENFDKRYGHIFFKTPYSHYRLRVELRFVGEQCPGGPGWAFRNSGAMLHCQPPDTIRKDQEFPVSIEAQFLGGNGKDKRTTANLCTPGTNVVMNGKLFTPHCTNSNSETYHGDQWVTVEMEVRGGKTIKHIIDGKTVLAYDQPQLDERDEDAKKLIEKNGGKKLLESGYISLQSESHPVHFRKVELLELPAE
ncbi:MAG: sulfatase-like hydrolase/transferase [Phycisphaeraceae bacterium]